MRARGFSAARRRVLAGALAALAPTGVLAHTPYRQWDVYRRKHLLLGASRDDPDSYETAKRLAALLGERLPRSKARVARAPNRERLASLVSTGQLMIVLLRDDEARAARTGSAPFERFGPFDLRLLGVAGQHLLLARPDLPAHHAWLISSALGGDAFAAAAARSGATGVPLHPGSAAFGAGDLIPPVATEVEAPGDDHHREP